MSDVFIFQRAGRGHHLHATPFAAAARRAPDRRHVSWPAAISRRPSAAPLISDLRLSATGRYAKKRARAFSAPRLDTHEPETLLILLYFYAGSYRSASHATRRRADIRRGRHWRLLRASATVGVGRRH